MSTKASSEDSSIEYGKRFLPPLWVDVQEEIERHIEEINLKSKETIFHNKFYSKFLSQNNLLINL